MWWLWITYGSAVFGIVRAWWIPYFMGAGRWPGGREQKMFITSHPLVPAGYVVRPGIVQITLHAGATLTLVMLGWLTFPGRAMFIQQ